MLFRMTISIGYMLTVLNIADVLQLDRFNPIVKGMMLAAGIIYVASRPRSWSIIIVGIAMLALVVFLGALTRYPYFEWGILAAAVTQFIIPLLLFAGHPLAEDRQFYLKTIVWIPVMSAIIGFAYGAVGIWNPFPIEFNTGSARFAGSMIPAYLGGFGLCGIVAGYKLIERGERIYLALVLTNFAIMAATGARMAMVIALFLLILSIYLSATVSMTRKLIFTIAGFCLSMIIVPIMLYIYSARLSESGMSGRDIMWPWLLSLSSRYPEYGIGFGHQFWSTPPDLVLQFGSAAAHNDYLRILVELGWFGTFAFYALLIIAAILAWRSAAGRRDSTVLLALFGYLTLSITDNALASPAYFTLLVTSIMGADVRSKYPPAKPGAL